MWKLAADSYQQHIQDTKGKTAKKSYPQGFH